MSQAEMLAAAEAFLDFIEHASGPAKKRLRKLTELLDRLNYAYHRVEGMEFTYLAAHEVERDYATEYEAIGNRFPELGFYAESESTESSLQPTTSDAIDDLCDIVGELRTVVWVWRNESPQLAANQFRTTFDVHWGRHSALGTPA